MFPDRRTANVFSPRALKPSSQIRIQLLKHSCPILTNRANEVAVFESSQGISIVCLLPNVLSGLKRSVGYFEFNGPLRYVGSSLEEGDRKEKRLTREKCPNNPNRNRPLLYYKPN